MDYKKGVQQIFLDSGVVLKETELEKIEYTNLGLGVIETEGLNLFVYESNERYYGRELVLLPYQTCLKRRHPPRGGNEGKKETFRCRKGLVYLYVEGEEIKRLSYTIPKGQECYYTTKREIIFHAGDQYTVEQNIKHWSRAGAIDAAIIEFSSNSDDSSDSLTNPAVYR